MFASGTWHLIMAVGWLALGVALVVIDPPNLHLRLFGLDFSAGWIALLFGGYDLARWWGLRAAHLRRRADDEMQRRHPPRRPSGEPESERNPDFMFDEPQHDEPP